MVVSNSWFYVYPIGIYIYVMMILYSYIILFVQSERSADMFHDDIFGESPAGIRKVVFI